MSCDANPDPTIREFWSSHRQRRLQPMQLPTPSTSHVNYAHVYEPAEDSFLILNTLSSPSETAFLRSRFPAPGSPSPLLLEIGSGSGVVVAFCSAHAESVFGRRDVFALAGDVNPYACRATAETVRLAAQATTKVITGATADSTAESTTEDSTETAATATTTTGTGCFLSSLTSDLASSIRANSVDILIFNPPYVPTEELPNGSNCDEFADRSDFSSQEEFERNSYLLALSYAGGNEGMEVTNCVLDALTTVLSDRGIAYLLLCAQNKPETVMKRVRGWNGGGKWKAEIVGFSGIQAGWEKLSIVRIWRV
ncbi:hypothetical protein K470DRAFT_256148 [Piedraia hortae CBS 480.64]|uniref:Uncharacterized protein n=1 Tax=Piedraia hortae CBS 480.64 TaxID=1314780 RepID=A0A6A7C5D0_9PEZI|nr:hypothetical protein K470DRAFT_256148 [Piedraia hortae CBS 480.64]